MKFTLENISLIKECLASDLPGFKAHQLMAPYQRKSAKEAITEGKAVRYASTLMLIYPKNGESYFALMLRPDYDGVHGGQVSFPGGKREKGETPEMNALRELEEEIGIPQEDIKLIGKLSDVYIPPSNMLVTPFVGVINYEPEFAPDPIEVEKVLEVPLEDVFKEELVLQKKIQVGKYTKSPFFLEVPYFGFCNHTVWGATALMISEFKMMMQEKRD